MAANVAIAATMAMGMIDQNVMGSAMNSKNPAHLFAVVCGKQQRPYITRADIWFTILIATITPAHSHSHCGRSSIGRSKGHKHATKQMSARLSSNAPVLVTHFSFRANHPSTISLMPQRA